MKGAVVVGLSGGVDSAVAALLLKEQGWAVSGLFMKNWEEDDAEAYCAAAEDLKEARAVAERLDIPLETVNFSAEYWDRVFELFLAEYRIGRTPNPDVLCNREIKFRAFLDHALERGADFIATGHYARLSHEPGATRLLRAADEEKDQTYFLYMVGQAALARTQFPLGGLRKSEVRERARAAGLPNFQRKDSTGICFIGERRFSDFLKRYLPASPGPIVTPEGIELGEHQGLMYYTLGQRKGMGIGGQAEGKESPWYVVDKDLDRNRLIVAQAHDHPLLLSSTLTATELHWVAGAPPDGEFGCQARIRHRQPLQDCAFMLSGSDPGRCSVRFEQTQRAVTPGQSIVFYRGDDCLGGGIIESRSTQGLAPVAACPACW
ncbi:MAG: tRNA 2-thiouridine(34) synthase MnmA [Gammaproteobacteria bacterium]|nr:tRNA 2-thiouridine(34) synthase MnmA [Gammaproteobacteria bacterium]MBU1655438.1 tRNA 2-thiouridine(34) synthase MnmA [Gammaproteobacteria bacterium]MBU1962405.1 tRNA 2-thiouridine(34) synthase MnmA [Gammaproteobacteria bacterium]